MLLHDIGYCKFGDKCRKKISAFKHVTHVNDGIGVNALKDQVQSLKLETKKNQSEADIEFCVNGERSWWNICLRLWKEMW